MMDLLKKRGKRGIENGFIADDMLIPDHIDIAIIHFGDETKHVFSLDCYNDRCDRVMSVCMSKDCMWELAKYITQHIDDIDKFNGDCPLNVSDDQMYH